MDKIRPSMGARSCRALLYDLAGRDIHVQLLLHSGQSVNGTVIVVGSEGRQEMVVVAHHRSDQVTYLAVDAVCAVTMSLNASAIPVVTGGKVQSEAELDPLSRLGFKRCLAQLEARLFEALGRPFPLRCDAELDEQRDALSPLARSIESLVEVLLSLRDDELGAEALGRLQAVELTRSEAGAVAVEGETLKVGLSPKLSPADWRPLVEAAL